jgi:SWI/SNF-related matrix-associated actin-dependent regulator of chromatin subfamily A3
MPSKVTALLAYLAEIPPEDRCAVFSYWTTTLDVIEQALVQSGILYCRYDGRLSRMKRDRVLQLFSSDSPFKVILVSITSGGQGLDLTAANHTVLIEPQWNPMLEEQAVSRVHRLRQPKPVTAIRLVVKDTWEERILRVQKRKKTLADLVIDRTQLTAEHERSQLWVCSISHLRTTMRFWLTCSSNFAS